jgi:chaperonin GroEL (HSP60 family)
MLIFLLQQSGTATNQDLGAQIRQQVQEQLNSAREQARVAREQARMAEQQAQQGGNGTAIIVPAAPPPPIDAIPPQAVDLAIAFFIMIAAIAIFTPLMRAIGRRLERSAPPAALDAGLVSQLQRIENTVDSMSVEIERISEAQRYMARLQTDKDAASRQLSAQS